MEKQNTKPVRKVILFGEAGVGKTSIKNRYLGKGFKRNYLATIGCDFSIYERDDIKLSIWDLAGEPNYNIVRKSFYEGLSGGIAIFDITRKRTLHMLSEWLDEIESVISYRFPVILVGNKEDLRDNGSNDLVTREYGDQFSKQMEERVELEVPLLFSSAKTGLNVELLFELLVDKIKLLDDQLPV